jgi:hypothetical protein
VNNSHGQEISDRSPHLSVTPRNVMVYVQRGAQHNLTKKELCRLVDAQRNVQAYVPNDQPTLIH